MSSRIPKQRSILFAAGASGGHIAPALAIAEALRNIDPTAKITFVGVGREVEKKMLSASDFDYCSIPFSPVLGRSLFNLVSLLFRIPAALLECRALFQEKNIDMVIGFGGYPCFIPVIYGWLTRSKVVLHEQNVKSGLANRLLARFAALIFAPSGSDIPAVKESLTHLPNPVRKEFYNLSAWTQHQKPLKLLVLGGSQGARNINNAIVDIVPFLKKENISLVHQTGNRDFQRVSELFLEKGLTKLECSAFFDNVEELIENSDIVISRAGAMAVAELSAAGRASIFVPLSISRAHQKDNILDLVKQEGAILVEDNENLSESLKKSISLLNSDRRKLFDMAKQMQAFSKHDGERPAKLIAEVLLDR